MVVLSTDGFIVVLNVFPVKIVIVIISSMDCHRACILGIENRWFPSGGLVFTCGTGRRLVIAACMEAHLIFTIVE